MELIPDGEQQPVIFQVEARGQFRHDCCPYWASRPWSGQPDNPVVHRDGRTARGSSED